MKWATYYIRIRGGYVYILFAMQKSSNDVVDGGVVLKFQAITRSGRIKHVYPDNYDFTFIHM